ncbi:MBL fold metallo-hydrolase [Bifidobacterium longum]|uniref:Metallo-beta-lactamase domain-containing protein n=1 Tax=Bifidobacterium longum subsp. longum TaxID=1679 RepID=A0A4R0UIB7_BIFLL|nr:MBL fold metallo-hydrolase [Bifidobacterium longum]TCF31204.1 hypothetical protein MCC10096_1524 [Bifidobacterium longum subsp. longum]
MRITQLGTAAAERIPGLFCRCALCRRAAETGGKDIRTQTQAVIDGHVLLDFPGDTYLHALHGELDLPAVSTLLVTHWHSDHFYGEDLAYRMDGYALDNPTPLTVYGSATVRGFYDRAFFLEQRYDDEHLRFVTVAPGDAFTTDDGYECHVFEARHGHEFGDCLIYAVSHDGRTMLYAHDTGFPYDRTWRMLKESGLVFDYVSMDCTHGLIDNPSWGTHMNLDQNVAMRRRMLDEGLAHDGTMFVANHFSHNGRATHAQLEERATGNGLVVAYDGMSVET